MLNIFKSAEEIAANEVSDRFAQNVVQRWREVFATHNPGVEQTTIGIPNHTRLYKRIAHTFLEGRGQELNDEQIGLVAQSFAEKLFEVGVSKKHANDSLTLTNSMVPLYPMIMSANQIINPEYVPNYLDNKDQLKQQFNTIFDSAREAAGLQPVVRNAGFVIPGVSPGTRRAIVQTQEEESQSDDEMQVASASRLLTDQQNRSNPR